jgi:phage terminase large subunit
MAATVANHNFSRCPRCGSRTQETQAWTGVSEFWLECSNPDCNTYINTYVPQPHQADFHRDCHRITANFGGYGSGKTLTSREELEKHILITSQGTSLVGANVTSQYEQTIKRDLEADFPKAFYAGYSNQKSFADFKNGHRLMYRPFDDANKLRSYNLTSWIILEASEVDEEAYTQLKTRLRNVAATVPEVDENGEITYIKGPHGQMVPKIKNDWRRGIIESNPSAGWIKTAILNCSDRVEKHGDIHDNYALLKEEQDPNISTHITSTSANAYLPGDFIEMLSKNKPKWWVERYVYGSFLYADGLVYPTAAKYICKTFDIPRNWKRICAFDYGLSDSACFLFGAIDEMENLLYFYKEVYVNNRNVAELAALFKEASADIPVGGWICSPIIDPKSGPRRDYDKKTLNDNFLDYGISFIPGAVNREARVFRLNTYLESGRVRIMDCCYNFIEQIKELKFKQNNNSTTSPWRDEPEDKNDHAVVCAEWIVMELPRDPKNLLWGAYNKEGKREFDNGDPYLDATNGHQKRDKDDWAYQALHDERDIQEVSYYYSNLYTHDGGGIIE